MFGRCATATSDDGDSQGEQNIRGYGQCFAGEKFSIPITDKADDSGVQVDNSPRFYQALVANKLPAACLIFEEGGYGQMPL